MPLKLKVLFVLAEAWPVAKTGGLGDVGPALARALIDVGAEVRLLIPAYRGAAAKLEAEAVGAPFRPLAASHRVRLLKGRLPEYGIPTWLLDCPPLYHRPGTPYGDEHGHDWPDNAERFGVLCAAASMFARGSGVDGWKADVIHGHDWHAGLASAYVALDGEATAATAFTVHNLAYQGNFDRQVRPMLEIEAPAFHMDGLEFHGHFSFMKAGLWYSDRLTTVSPTYARQILEPAYGCGMDGLLRHRSDRLSGILNGVDHHFWDPRRDSLLPAAFGPGDLKGKARCKQALQEKLGLPGDPRSPLVGMVGRMAHQKGWDLLIEALPDLAEKGLQFALVGSGDEALEARLRELAAARPDSVALFSGYDEAVAHLVFAGADLFAVPSRFEPAGLTQMYAQCYGTPPVVRRTGGLVDTVTEATPEAVADGTGTGFFFDAATAAALAEALGRAAALLRDDPLTWRRIQENGMRRDFSWDQAAGQYMEVYEKAIEDRRARV
ncbi:MAG: glycogen synthase GlgA [Gammaproteobacteria bacterium]